MVERIFTENDLNKIFGKKFNEQWNGIAREIPYVEVFKKRGETLHISQLLHSVTTSNGENLALANIAIIQLIEYLNNHIEQLNRDFADLKMVLGQSIDISDHIYKTNADTEILAYLLKTILDKVIVLKAVSTDELQIDCIGALLHGGKIDTFCGGIFLPYKDFLETINGLHNAYKHTFSNLQLINIVPSIEPCMFAVYKMHNSTRTPTKFYHLICSNAVDQFCMVLESSKI